ncbi:MAG TPA: hypothetical protein VF941_20125 [Clostridia bacterium]
MAGTIKRYVESYITQMSKGNPTMSSLIKSRLCLRGILVDKYNENSPDDPVIIEKLLDIAKQSNIKL